MKTITCPECGKTATVDWKDTVCFSCQTAKHGEYSVNVGAERVGDGLRNHFIDHPFPFCEWFTA
jgi:hypothetical protein